MIVFVEFSLKTFLLNVKHINIGSRHPMATFPLLPWNLFLFLYSISKSYRAMEKKLWWWQQGQYQYCIMGMLKMTFSIFFYFSSLLYPLFFEWIKSNWIEIASYYLFLTYCFIIIIIIFSLVQAFTTRMRILEAAVAMRRMNSIGNIKPHHCYHYGYQNYGPASSSSCISISTATSAVTDWEEDAVTSWRFQYPCQQRIVWLLWRIGKVWLYYKFISRI